MAVLMQHPQHGWTHAYSSGEVDRLKALGWSVVGEPVAQEQAPQKKKPGPKPKAK